MIKKDFNELNLEKNVLQAIEYMGFEAPSQIQAEIIPKVFEGGDLIGQAQTGTGKTLAFGAPIISCITKKKASNNIDALILTPTRELAIQVTEELKRIAKYSRVRVLSVYGGDSIEKQIRALRNGVNIVVGTPGRIMDHINRKSINFKDISFLVIDEADEMLNMGFIDDIEFIIQNSNEHRQTMLFSATMPDPIKKLASKYMKEDLKHIAIVKKTLTADKIKQYYFPVKNSNKFEALCRIIDADEPQNSIIFCKTKKGVDELVGAMQLRGYNVEGMHGDMSQNQRINTLRKFKETSLNFLVATDVAARGIDVHDVSHVINYDMPQDLESYVHRIGRTGRANKEGTAYSLVTSREQMMVRQIERFTKSSIKKKTVPTVDDIFETKYNNLVSSVKDALKEDNYTDFIPMIESLKDEFDLVDISSALMKMIFDKEMVFQYDENSMELKSNSRLFFSIGRMDNITPKRLLQFIQETAQIDVSEIGDIDILEKFTFMDVPSDLTEIIMKKSSGKRLNRRKVNIEIAQNKRS